MTAGKVFPRPAAQHEARAAEVLRSFALRFSWPPALPIPVDRIIEQAFDLRIEWGPVAEKAGEQVLGALDPQTKTVHMNEKHLQLFEAVIGPERFTLAHELGHWIYDASPPDQLTFDVGVPETVFCRDTRSRPDTDSAKIREINANKFAACLLLPSDLVRAFVQGMSKINLPNLAAEWGVSKATLRIRIGDLGLGHLLST